MTAKRRSAAPAPGFTLVEVMVALVIGAVLLSTVVSVLTLTLRDARRTRVHSELLRDAESVTHQLNSELRLAGLGLPRGANIDASYGTSPPAAPLAALIVAGATEIGIVADLPRPDANFNTFGGLHGRDTGAATIAWHNENNGACVPDSTSSSCSAGVDSVFFPVNATGCTTTGTSGFNDRLCPWGMRRGRANESILIVAGDGQWSRSVLSGSVSAGTIRAADLSTAYSRTTWPQGPGAVAGQGFVATLDRVFYWLDGTKIRRRQCWGDPNPNDPQWSEPPSTASWDPAATDGGSAGASECTPAEVVARNVSSLSFTYTTGTDGVIRKVDYAIGFARTVDGRPVLHVVNGAIRLTNIP